MDMGEKLVHAMESHRVFTINIFDYSIPVTDTVIVMWIIMAVMVILAYIFTRRLQAVPSGKQNVAEVIVDFVNGICKTNIGHHWKLFAPYLGTLLLFLVFSNTAAVFNIIPGESFKIYPPTKNINVTACLAIVSILIVAGSGIRVQGLGGWIKGLARPNPIMIPFNILDYVIRPFSLCLRLFGNIIGAFIVMEIIYSVMPAVVPAFLSIYFDFFDGILQAYIFVFLTSLYLAEAIE